MSNVPIFSGKRTDNLIIVRYHTSSYPSPKGLVLMHTVVVHPDGADPGKEAKTAQFSVPMAQQDDMAVIERRWRDAIDQFRRAYALEGRLVDMDIRIPLHIVKTRQSQVPDVIKEILNEDSAPE